MHLVFDRKFRRIPSVLFTKIAAAFVLISCIVTTSQASDFYQPWRNKQKAIVIDAYEKNPINWHEMVKNKQIRGFIGKASDGLPSPWACPGNETEKKICKKSFQNYFMKQQLYHTRKTLAKALGLKWGAYHLGRPGNPIHQANHFLDFAKPEEDELIALDIEHDDPKKWISFKDAEIFARQIYARIGRYPVLYTNHNTAQRIAARRAEFPLLSRLPLWYARFKGDVRDVFPMGNWESYTLWQFSAHPNCSKRRCLYRVRGTEPNIDVNVSTLTIDEFEKAWPFNELVPVRKPSVDNNPEVLMVDNDKPELSVASKQITTASILATYAAEDKPLSKEASFQLASIDLDNIAIPTARERDVPSFGITTTDYQPEYEVVIPQSEHAEDLTMQLQYLSGAL